MLPAERRTVTIGVAVSAFALLLAFGVIPYLRRWNERESLVAAKSAQLARMRQAVADSAATRNALARATALADGWPQRVLAAPSREVASAVLQAQLRDWAVRAGVQLTRMEGDTAQGGGEVEATMVLVSDAPGLAALLDDAAAGRHVARVRTIDLLVNPVLRGPSPLLNVTLGVSAPWRRE